MTRFIALLILASPAYAATLHPITIEECVRISAKDMARDAVERVDVCAWTGPPINPLPYDMLADLKGPPKRPTPPVTVTGLPSAHFLPVGRGSLGSATASASAWSSAGAFSYASCGCVTEPDKPEPSPVPLPAGLPLYAALVGALGLWRMRHG